jgi:hypothetical protein
MDNEVYKVTVTVKNVDKTFVFHFDESAESEAFCDATMRVGFGYTTGVKTNYYTSSQVESIEKKYQEE